MKNAFTHLKKEYVVQNGQLLQKHPDCLTGVHRESLAKDAKLKAKAIKHGAKLAPFFDSFHTHGRDRSNTRGYSGNISGIKRK